MFGNDFDPNTPCTTGRQVVTLDVVFDLSASHAVLVTGYKSAALHTDTIAASLVNNLFSMAVYGGWLAVANRLHPDHRR